MSIERWLDKQNVVFTYSGISFSLKEEGNCNTCYNMGEIYRDILLSKIHPSQKTNVGTSLVVQWLKICTSSAGSTIWSLVRELRSHMLHAVAKKQKGRMLCESYEVPRVVKFIVTESGIMVAGTEVRGGRELLFNRYHVSVLPSWKSSADGWWWCLYSNVNVLCATELYTQRWLKC